MEENRRISWSDLFIKVILVVIFVLFTVWLLSLSNKGLSNSLNVLTDNIFSENIEKMKEVGKEYFTIERLPEKVGDVKTLTLEKMYEKKLILELKDKYGNSCSAENSYISIEKYDTEYQMKVYLECGEESDYIIVIMGCYDYCDTDICEKEIVEDKEIEYEYMKPFGGYWTDWGKWSEWSKVSVTKTDYRQVETKKVEEEYSYDKTIVETVYEEFDLKCPSGYKLTSDKTKCYKPYTDYEYTDPVCPTVSGYTLISRNGFTCNYSKPTSSLVDPVCPTVSGYTLISRNGFTCSYSKPTSSLVDPVCPTVNGFNLTGRNGFTCNYSKTITKTADPICPSKSGWTYTGRNGFTCNYKRTVQSSDYTLSYVSTKTGSYVPADTSTYDYVQIDADYVYDCNNSCAFRWVYTYKVYKKVYGTTTEYDTESAYCSVGSKSGNTCAYTDTETTTRTAECKSGTNNGNGKCAVTGTDTTTRTATCTVGSKSGNRCAKPVTKYTYKDLIKTCPTDYYETKDGSKCYQNIETTVTVTGTREVTYYRYRIREYIGGTVDYKWSKSKNDKKLLDDGYKLTGRTR